MIAEKLVVDARSQGVIVYRIEGRLCWRAMSPIEPHLRERLREHRGALLAFLPEGLPRTAVASSTIEATCEGATLGPADASDSTPVAENWLGLRIHSRILSEDVWLVPDDATADALERELEAGVQSELVFTLAEVFAMEAMLAADMRTIAKLKHTLAGAGLGGRVESVGRREGSA